MEGMILCFWSGARFLQKQSRNCHCSLHGHTLQCQTFGIGTEHAWQFSNKCLSSFSWWNLDEIYFLLSIFFISIFRVHMKLLPSSTSPHRKSGSGTSVKVGKSSISDRIGFFGSQGWRLPWSGLVHHVHVSWVHGWMLRVSIFVFTFIQAGVHCSNLIFVWLSCFLCAVACPSFAASVRPVGNAKKYSCKKAGKECSNCLRCRPFTGCNLHFANFHVVLQGFVVQLSSRKCLWNRVEIVQLQLASRKVL